MQTAFSFPTPRRPMTRESDKVYHAVLFLRRKGIRVDRAGFDQVKVDG